MVSAKDESLRCSFCGQSRPEVKRIVFGPNVGICNECIDICNEIIFDDRVAENHAAQSSASEQPMQTIICPNCGEVYAAPSTPTDTH